MLAQSTVLPKPGGPWIQRVFIESAAVADDAQSWKWGRCRIHWQVPSVCDFRAVSHSSSVKTALSQINNWSSPTFGLDKYERKLNWGPSNHSSNPLIRSFTSRNPLQTPCQPYLTENKDHQVDWHVDRCVEILGPCLIVDVVVIEKLSHLATVVDSSLVKLRSSLLKFHPI